VSTNPRAQRVQLHSGTELRYAFASDLECRDIEQGDGFEFRGYASLTDAPYDMEDFSGLYQEIIQSGAFKQSLADGPDVAFKVDHQGPALARTMNSSGKPPTMRLSEDERGLYVVAKLNQKSVRAQELREAVARGDVDSMSFAFRVPKGGQTWNDDFTKRTIHRIDLHEGDVSAVTHAAARHTGGLVSMRHRGNGGPGRAASLTIPSNAGLDRAKAQLLELGGRLPSPKRKPLTPEQRARRALDELRRGKS
jgi:HK97 family phage prohead protease